MALVGVFGGAFNPIHMGHINSLTQVQKNFSLDQIKIIPAYQSPGKDIISKPSPEDRCKMAELCLKDLGDNFLLDDYEIEQKGISYTIETLRHLKAQDPAAELYLIIGLDQFNSFDSWKEFEDIVKMSHLIVTSRPGYTFPLNKSSFPQGLQSLIEDFDGYQSLLKSGKMIHFIRLKDIDVSSSEIRKKLQIGQAVDKFLSLKVENYIKENKLYESDGPKVNDYKSFTIEAANFLESKNAINTLAFDFESLNDYMVDYSIVCSATNKRQTVSMAEALIEKMKATYSVRPIAIDGIEDGRWVVLDYGSLIVHIFYDFVRQEYHLEQLWQKAEKLEFNKPKA